MGFDAPNTAGVRSTLTTVTTGKAMNNPLPVATGHHTASPDGNADEQPIASVIDTNVVLVPKSQIVDEHVAVNWFQEQQAQFAARFFSPSFREG